MRIQASFVSKRLHGQSETNTPMNHRAYFQYAKRAAFLERRRARFFLSVFARFQSV